MRVEERHERVRAAPARERDRLAVGVVERDRRRLRRRYDHAAEAARLRLRERRLRRRGRLRRAAARENERGYDEGDHTHAATLAASVVCKAGDEETRAPWPSRASCAVPPKWLSSRGAPTSCARCASLASPAARRRPV